MLLSKLFVLYSCTRLYLCLHRVTVVMCFVHYKDSAFCVGTEPWTFYFKNMFLNMNIVFILALLSTVIITVRVSDDVNCLVITLYSSKYFNMPWSLKNLWMEFHKYLKFWLIYSTTQLAKNIFMLVVYWLPSKVFPYIFYEEAIKVLLPSLWGCQATNVIVYLITVIDVHLIGWSIIK